MTITKSVLNENTRLRVMVSERSKALREAQDRIDRAIEIIEASSNFDSECALSVISVLRG